MTRPANADRFSAADHQYMARALELAARGAYTCAPNPQVGCVLVREGKIVGEGWHQRTGEAHAEVMALAASAESARGAAAYVTLEPCAHHGRTGPCADALIAAGVAAVVGASEDPDERVSGRGYRRLQAAGVNVRTGLMASTARRLNAGFFKRLSTGVPYVRVKVASSLDGATALVNGQSRWITGSEARRDVHRLRARSGAIITGAGTVLADDPRMTVRLDELENAAAPLPVILDRHMRCSLQAKIFAHKALVFSAADQSFPINGSVEYEAVPTTPDDRRLDLTAVLQRLAARQISDVLVEAGPRLSGAFVKQRLCDELIVYQAPKLMGSAAHGMLDLGVFEDMQEAIELEMLDTRRVGETQKMVFRLKDG